ncbi:hypothetical protein BH09ACT8_BH09ACT8_57740 [soil metagenome]
MLPTAAAAALAACGRAAQLRTVVNVRDYGTVGDGKADESAAIKAAVAALRPGCVLRFPSGSYRFAQRHPSGSAAIAIIGLSDVAIEFDTGTELVMDNLDENTGAGTSHGILIRGPASRIALRNIKIRWSRQTTRSFGDGIRILGYPAGIPSPPVGWTGPPTPVDDVEISGCEVRSSPQAGVILIGTSGIKISGLKVQGTSADGLHFNACRQASVDDFSAQDNGDDGLALVTYFAESTTFDEAAQTFAFPALTDWSNADFAITNITVAGGRANGVRLSGVNRVSLTGLTASDRQSGAGVMVDSASTVRAESAWRYVASRGVRLSKVAVSGCETGVHVLARPSDTGDSRFTDFDVDITDATFRSCSNWSVRIESPTAQPVAGVALRACDVDASSSTGGHGGVGMGNAALITLGDISVTHTQPVILFSATDTANFMLNRLQLTITDSGTREFAPIPCALFEDSSGTVNELSVRWLDAPATWIPIRVADSHDHGDHEACVNPYVPSPVYIRDVAIDPTFVTNRIGRC